MFASLLRVYNAGFSVLRRRISEILSSGKRGCADVAFLSGGGKAEPVGGVGVSVRKRGEDGLTV